jgi:hypothetical protein
MRLSTPKSLGESIGSIARVLAAIALRSVVLYFPTAVEAQVKVVNDRWSGESGQWSKAVNWSNGVPNNGSPKDTNYSVSIVNPAKSPASVTISDISPTINNLTIGKANRLSLTKGEALTVVAGAAGSGVGSINNMGTINLTATGSYNSLVLNGKDGTVTFTGGGTVALSKSTASITGSTESETLHNVNNSIQGGGRIRYVKLVNEGTVSANQSSTELDITPSKGGVTNSGRLQATNGGRLNLREGTYTNSGTIVASGTGPNNYYSRVNLSGSVTNTGYLMATNGGNLVLEGTYTNTGGTILARGTGPSGNAVYAATVELIVSAINGGTLTTAAGGVISSTEGTLNNVTISTGSQVQVDRYTTKLQGTITNGGKFSVSGQGSAIDGKDAVFTNQSGATLSLSKEATGTVGTLNNPAGATVAIDGKGTKLIATKRGDDDGQIVLTNGGKLDPPTLSGSGQLRLYTGSSATLGSYTMNTGGGLVVDRTSLLQISGDWSNQLKDATKFQVDGRVELNGGSALRHIEVAGHEYGNTIPANSVAFSNNFNIGSASAPNGTLQIDSGAHVMLVDAFDNGNRGGFGSQTSPVTWSGSPTGTEAMYVWNLVIEPNATIDFDGLHLYYETGASGWYGPDPSTWFADLAMWKAQGDVFIGGEPILIPMASTASVPEPSSLWMMVAGLGCLSVIIWFRRKSTVAVPAR